MRNLSWQEALVLLMQQFRKLTPQQQIVAVVVAIGALVWLMRYTLVLIIIGLVGGLLLLKANLPAFNSALSFFAAYLGGH